MEVFVLCICAFYNRPVGADLAINQLFLEAVMKKEHGCFDGMCIVTGLWMADLTITQLFLEAVVESERGVVSGVQSSLNKLMDVLKFVLVVVIPDTETFGFLIIISFAFICLGWLLYAIFLRRERGHFFHCPKCGTHASYDSL